MNFSQGHSEQKFEMSIVLVFLRKNTRIHKMGEIHELFVLALALVWFAGATPEMKSLLQKSEGNFSEQISGWIARGIFWWIFPWKR